MRFRLVVDGESHEIDVVRDSKRTHVRVDGADYRVRPLRRGDGFVVHIGKTAHRVRFVGERVMLDDADHRVSIAEIQDEVAGAHPKAKRAHAVIQVRPPMPGRVIRVAMSSMSRVRKGQTLLVLEAMKMQNEIVAPESGTIREVHVNQGELIAADRVIAVLELE
jgi:biotin carboxyl carrier protein